jgi:hypothetical protein
LLDCPLFTTNPYGTCYLLKTRQPDMSVYFDATVAGWTSANEDETC